MRIKILFILICLFALPSVGLTSMTIDQAMFNLGQKMYSQRDYQEAARQFSDLLVRYPDTVYYNQSVYYLAKSYYYLGQYDRSRTHFSSLLSHAANDTEKRWAVFGLAQSYHKQGNWSKAARYYSDFGRKYKDSPVCDAALYYAGQCYEQIGDRSLAIDSYRAVVNEFPRGKYYTSAAEQVIRLQGGSSRVMETPEEPEWQPAATTKPADDSWQNNYNPAPTPTPAAPVTKKEPVSVTPAVPATKTETPAEFVPRLGNLSGEVEVVIPELSLSGEKSEPENGSLNSVELTVPAEPEIRYIYLTNYISSETLVPLTNTLLLTNRVVLTQRVRLDTSRTNFLSITNKVTFMDTNRLQINDSRKQNEKKEEEIERLRKLLEFKAKLLEMKEQAMREKETLIKSNSTEIRK